MADHFHQFHLELPYIEPNTFCKSSLKGITVFPNLEIRRDAKLQGEFRDSLKVPYSKTKSALTIENMDEKLQDNTHH
jgi:hypothetical protein